MSLNAILTIRTQEIGGQKWRPVEVGLPSRAEKKKRYMSAMSDVSGSIAGLNGFAEISD